MNMADDSRLIGGPERRAIVIADYDTAWPRQYEAHRRVIASALGDTLLRIEHIGSTSVPGLAAKPIIDILIVVPDAAVESAYVPQLGAVGYLLRVREPDFHEHRMLRTAARDVHVHVYSHGSPEIDRSITFRNRLCHSAGDRARYEAAKRRLAARNWPDMNAYADAKTSIIESILAAAHREDHTMVRLGHFAIPVRDVARSREWYVSNFGFEVELEVPERGTIGLKDDGDQTLFLEETAQAIVPSCKFALEVADAEAKYRELSAKGIRFEKTPQNLYWGYGAEVRDPDGYLVSIWDERSMREKSGR